MFEEQDCYMLVTELSESGDLSHKLIENGPFSEIEASNILRQVLYALNHCHSEKICHRDIKL